jgi:hypothetical protein
MMVSPEYGNGSGYVSYVLAMEEINQGHSCSVIMSVSNSRWCAGAWNSAAPGDEDEKYLLRACARANHQRLRLVSRSRIHNNAPPRDKVTIYR